MEPSNCSVLKESPTLPSPIGELPNEILGEIFVLCGEETVIDEDGSPTVMIPALTLNRVNSRWRSLCRGIEQIYSTFKVVLLQAVRVEKRQQSDVALRYILEQSGGSPLNVTLRVIPDYKIFSEELHPTLSALMTASQRFRTLSLDILPFDPSFDRLRGNLSLLERLELVQWITFSVLSDADDLFADAPRLRCLHLRGLYYLMKLPCDRITFLRYVAGSVLDFNLSMLGSYTNLQTLQLEVEFTHRAQPGLVVLPNLHTLSIMFPGKNSSKGVICVFKSFCFPSLTCLTIKAKSRYTRLLPVKTFSSFLSRSSCALKDLTLDGGDITVNAEELTALLKLMPSLTSFTIRQPGWARPVLTLLTLQTLSVLPSLTHLTLSIHADSTPDEEFLEMVTCLRRKGGLQSFHLHVPDRKISRDLLKAFRNLRLAGLAVSVTDERGILI